MTEKATKEQREAAAKAHGCEGCAVEHGDQGLTKEELEVDRLRAEVAEWKRITGADTPDDLAAAVAIARSKRLRGAL